MIPGIFVLMRLGTLVPFLQRRRQRRPSEWHGTVPHPAFPGLFVTSLLPPESARPDHADDTETGHADESAFLTGSPDAPALRRRAVTLHPLFASLRSLPNFAAKLLPAPGTARARAGSGSSTSSRSPGSAARPTGRKPPGLLSSPR